MLEAFINEEVKNEITQAVSFFLHILILFVNFVYCSVGFV